MTVAFLLINLNLSGAVLVGNTLYADSVVLPECIKKLSAPPGKGIRSSLGAKKFRKIHTLENGRILYVFHSQPSIGCHINEPASTKYYNDSCKLVASFPHNFSSKKGFKPFVAAGYAPADFPEAAAGDYPAYFANLEKEKTAIRVIKNDAKPKDPFPIEKTFSVMLVQENVMDLKKGDVLKVSTKAGLKHYRDNKLLNQFKLIPQLTTIRVEAKCKVPPCFVTETNALVYYMGAIKRFIEIRNNTFMISAGEYQDAVSPAANIQLSWQKAYGLNAK